ncbi:hypothetical protein MYSTI_01028 [Myxococcus stipitatus DSM 14675]|uniref:Lipoprotein n=1 Tax=Myxococcus stipitatus (strain DSM 14675 / JCM 12634 / Mx s8) TaxID=1278073 RepID=L7U491_MYXSD|nr:hypothetical protein [Myxococcus stipitatus]AGC42377.1 hypothetical protein MYSTI_01028 [Myxococcus stipitatus DSM 14675]
MQSLIQKLALVSLLGVTACGAPHDSDGDFSSETDTTEQEINGTEVTLPLCDLSAIPSGWSCWQDYDKTLACPTGAAPAVYWLRPNSGSEYVRADANFGRPQVKVWSLSWGLSAFFSRGQSVFCNGTNTYRASTWSRYTGTGPGGTGTPQLQAKLTSVVDHIRDALVRGTAFAVYDEFYCATTGGCSDATSLILVLNKKEIDSATWTEIGRKELPLVRGALVGAFEIEASAPKDAQVNFEVYVKNSFNSISEVVFHDLRLFTEKCIPDMVNPGQCLP